MYDISRLIFRETCHLGKSFEKLATFDNLRDDIIVLIVLYQVNNSYDVWMTFFSQNW